MQNRRYCPVPVPQEQREKGHSTLCVFTTHLTHRTYHLTTKNPPSTSNTSTLYRTYQLFLPTVFTIGCRIRQQVRVLLRIASGTNKYDDCSMKRTMIRMTRKAVYHFSYVVVEAYRFCMFNICYLDVRSREIFQTRIKYKLKKRQLISISSVYQSLMIGDYGHIYHFTYQQSMYYCLVFVDKLLVKQYELPI